MSKIWYLKMGMYLNLPTVWYTWNSITTQRRFIIDGSMWITSETLQNICYVRESFYPVHVKSIYVTWLESNWRSNKIILTVLVSTKFSLTNIATRWFH